MQDDNPQLRRFARRMRREPTTAESAMWRLLRHRRLAGFKFRRQHPFGPYILDCYCPRAHLVIELDGDSHATDEGRQADAGRQDYLATRGISILRFWNTEVVEEQEAVLERIVRECVARTANADVDATSQTPGGEADPQSDETSSEPGA
jgi:very-short-patch-repair endonuclease